jgi:predicted nucleotidyltransferase
MGTHDREGVDDDGFIVSGADAELISAGYQPALESVVSSLVGSVEGLISVYLYGSVATGEACPPQSDIDVLVVTRDGGSSAAVADAAKDLSWRYRHLAREVGIAHATMAGLFGDDIDALGERCFIKHYCVLLHGDDLRAQLPRYRPSATMAWAFNHNVAAAIAEARQRLDTASESGDVKQVCRSIARKVMLAAASLTTVIDSEWTTDRHRAAGAIAEHYPEWADQATVALEWASAPTDDPSKVRKFLDGFGTWIAQELQDRAAPR